MTKDERFLLEIFRRIQAKGDPKGTIDALKLGKELGMRDHLAGNILGGLMKANFIKKYGENEFGLTELGRKIAQSLMQ